jgi:hypothetical protein
MDEEHTNEDAEYPHRAFFTMAETLFRRFHEEQPATVPRELELRMMSRGTHLVPLFFTWRINVAGAYHWVGPLSEEEALSVTVQRVHYMPRPG